MMSENVYYILLIITFVALIWGLYSIHRANKCLDDLAKLIWDDKGKKEPDVLYLCDCRNPECGDDKDCELCHHTTNVEHASNFECTDGAYWEKERP